MTEHHCPVLDKGFGKVWQDQWNDSWHYSDDHEGGNEDIFYCPMCGVKL